MSVFDKGKMYGLDRSEVTVLFYIARWFNFHPIRIEGEKTTIADRHEPDLWKLCSRELHRDKVADAAEKLKSDGMIEREWIAGRPCSWSPTDRGLNAIEYIFSDYEDLYPFWSERHGDGEPLYRDGTERLLHRKGVCATTRLLDDMQVRVSPKIYPRVPIDHLPDVRWLSDDGEEVAYFEVLSDHNDLEALLDKWHSWLHAEHPSVVWVFENREMMVKMWNHIHRTSGLNLDGGEFGGDRTNWSPRRVNQRLRRTRRQQDDYNGIDACWTIGGVLGAEPSDGVEFLQLNNIIS